MSKINLYVEEKVVIWRSSIVEVNAESEDEAVRKYLEGDFDYINSEFLLDSEEPLSPRDNCGNSTLEISSSEDCRTLYSNGHGNR